MTIPNFVGNIRQNYQRDGILSWFVCFSAFVSNAIIYGIGSSFGVMFGSIMKDFNATEDSVAGIHSVQAGVRCFSAFLASIFAEKIGFAHTIAFGTLVVTMSMAISIISNSVSTFTLYYGFFAGFGLGLIFTPCNIICSFHFIKRRSLATGITICGSGIGIILVSQAMSFVVLSYGWKGCIMICAFVSPLNGLMAIIAYVLPEHNHVSTVERNERNMNSTDEAVNISK